MVNDLSRKQLPKPSSRSSALPAKAKENLDDNLTNLDKYKMKLKAQKEQPPSRSPSDP